MTTTRTVVGRVALAAALSFLPFGCASLRPAEPVGVTEAHDQDWRYAVVIDAGSSGSRALVYQWQEARGNGLPRIEAAPFPRAEDEDPWEQRVEAGLDSFSDDPEAAARSLEPLIEFALDRIGASDSRRAVLVLGATGGLRLLSAEVRDPIIAAIESYFATLPFGSSSARVISGSEEGVYGWIGANYLLGLLEGGRRFPTVGALDLGGASVQITFVPLDYPDQHGQVVEIDGTSYHLYTHSALGSGQDEIRWEHAVPACFLRGYPLSDSRVGTGDFDACRGHLRRAVAVPCSPGVRRCTLLGVSQPPVYGEFLAFSVFAYTADFFGLDERLSPAALAEAGREYCARDWPSMVAADPSLESNPYVPNYCFAAAYIATLLSDGFGFPEETDRIRAPLRLQGAETGWTLGALVDELAGRSD